MKNEIALQLLRILGVIFATAGVAMTLNWLIRGERRGQADMRKRFLVEVFILAGVFVPTYLGGAWLLFAAVVLGCLCAAELYGTFESGGDSPYKLSGIVTGLAVMFYAYTRPGVVGDLFPWLFALYWVLRFATGSRADSLLGRLKRTCFGVLYPFFCLAFFVEIGQLEHGFGYVVFYYGLAEVNDSAAYLVGSTLGKHKIFPKLSPNKTVEGVLGGFAFTLAIAFLGWFAVPDWGPLEIGAGALLVAAAGLCGDLFASRLKRRVGVKDYGESVPTQGGVLDVYDAFIFVAPVFYYYLLLIGRAV